MLTTTEGTNSLPPSRWARMMTVVRKGSATLQANPYYNLAVGLAVLITSAMDIIDNIRTMRTQHLLLLVSVLMIIEAVFKLTKGYERAEKGLKDSHIPEKVEKEAKIIETEIEVIVTREIK